MTPEEYVQHVSDFLQANSHALYSWQPVEQNLFFVFQDLVDHDREPDLISAVFHSVNGLAIRVDMTTAAARIRLTNNKPLLQKWIKLAKRVKDESIKRNYLAHYTLYQARPPGKDAYLAIRPTMFDPLADRTKEFGIKELEQWGRDFGLLAAALDEFAHAIQK